MIVTVLVTDHSIRTAQPPSCRDRHGWSPVGCLLGPLPPRRNLAGLPANTHRVGVDPPGASAAAWVGRTPLVTASTTPGEQPFPHLDLKALIGMAVGDAVASAEAAGVTRIRLIELDSGSVAGAVDMSINRRRLTLVQQGGVVSFAGFDNGRSVGTSPLPTP